MLLALIIEEWVRFRTKGRGRVYLVRSDCEWSVIYCGVTAYPKSWWLKTTKMNSCPLFCGSETWAGLGLAVLLLLSALV